MTTQEACNRAKFADWYYLRTGQRVTTDRGRKAMKAFLAGLPIKIVAPKSGPFTVFNGQIPIKESRVKPYKKF
jgi:hypothetical protein